MEPDLSTLSKLVQNAQTILITSHIGPDGDSVCSSLLLSSILRENYPNKQVQVSLEEKPFGLDFINGVSELTIVPLKDSLNGLKPDLVIILDANTVDRVSRDPEAVRSWLNTSTAKVAIIDHHEPHNTEKNDIYVNNASPAVTLDIYEIFIEGLGLRKPSGYATTALTGIYTDTGGFVFRNLNYQKTFEVVPKLIQDGADLEEISSNLTKISDEAVYVLKELLDNLTINDDHIWTFLSDETAGSEAKLEPVRQALDIFRSQLLRYVEGRPWGFVVYKDVLAADSTYSISFRAISDTEDVSELARRLGGGGHKPAAGAKLKASSVEEAVDKVKTAIASG